MDTTTIEQACDSANWKWRRFDVRSDGLVFWQYQKQSANGEYWTTWESALNKRSIIKHSQKTYKFKNPEKIKTSELKHREKNKHNKKKQYKIYLRRYEKERIRTDPVFCLKKRIRTRVAYVIKNNGFSKKSKTNDTLGCDWLNLKIHIESKFTNGMAWDNRHLWHIDHIIPLASAKSVEEVIRLCHYTNLQPLWAEDNLKKGAKIMA